MAEIRRLDASEIECRVATINEKGCSLLLYKDARVDMRILDEVFGPMNWKRDHEVVNGNLFCTISIYDKDKKEWVSKQDVGTESYTEKEKGQASDAFKRAGFNWGIGRELYTAPFIWVNLEKNELVNRGGKWTTYEKFFVSHIGYSRKGEINELEIVDKNGVKRFTMGKGSKKAAPSIPGMYTGSQHKEAISKMQACRSRAEVQKVWNEFSMMQKDAEFSNVCMEMCKKFPK